MTITCSDSFELVSSIRRRLRKCGKNSSNGEFRTTSIMHSYTFNICQKFHIPEIVELRKDYPHGYHKVDKLGRPIYIERVGFLNPDKVFKFTTEDRLLHYYALSYETLITKIFDACTQFRKKSTGEDKRVAQTCTILDLKDVKLGSASKAYNFVKPASAMAQDNYP